MLTVTVVAVVVEQPPFLHSVPPRAAVDYWWWLRVTAQAMRRCWRHRRRGAVWRRACVAVLRVLRGAASSPSTVPHPP